MSLETYRKRRDFALTPEPEAVAAPPLGEARQFVVHKHDATRLHYDVRLELDGVLKCWAVPKGPSLDPAVKRLAVETEDHPYEYLSFEGVIPAGEYGGGPMLVWDRGLWFPEGDAQAALDKGHLSFRLEGEKLRGRWTLVRTRGGDGRKPDKHQWMLIKKKDDASAAEAVPLVDARPESVRTGRDIDAVMADGVAATLRDVVRAGDPAAIAGAERGALPESLAPQLASPMTAPPAGPDWLAEVKLDGYRLVALKRGQRVRLLTRSGQDWTQRFLALAREMALLPARDAALDGEAVVFDAQGRSDFGALQEAQSTGGDPDRIAYVAFDLLHLDGWNLTRAPLAARKEALRLLLAQHREARAGAPLHYSDHVVGHAADMLREACAMGLEGIVAKRADARYVGGRTRTWVKVKCLARQELIIVGYTDAKGASAGERGVGALLLGVNDYGGSGGGLRYAGKVGTGFGAATLRNLAARLAPLARTTPAVTGAPKARGVHWVEPRLVAEIAFSEWTRDGVVRQSSFIGLREDKPAREVVVERADPPAADADAPKLPGKPRAVTQIAGVRLTHPDKIMFPDLGVTKIELAEYYQAVAPLILPHLAARPLSLVRCPDGVRGSCFYQKHAHKGVPAAVPRVMVGDDREPYLMIDSLESLLSLVHFGVIELHVWGARADRLDQPDLLVMDLDPAPDVPWSLVAKTALALREQLEALGLVPFLRSTGGKGLHVVAPLVRRATCDWDAVKEVAHGLAIAFARRDPKHFTVELAKNRRRGRIFIDYLRNTRHATAVAPWSVRAKDGAPVAEPLAWDALDLRHGPPLASLREVLARVSQPGWIERDNPWAAFESSRRTLTRAMRDAVASLVSPSASPSR